MKEIETRLREKIRIVEEFKVTGKDLAGIIKKRKNWSAPGFDGIQNFWWKTFTAVWKPMSRAMQKCVEDDKTIPEWIALRRTVMLPKSTDLAPEKDYRPITCLNTSYKMFTRLLANYMKHHADENEMWDKSQMETYKDVLGTVDQLLIDNCIMDEVKTHKKKFSSGVL